MFELFLRIFQVVETWIINNLRCLTMIALQRRTKVFFFFSIRLSTVLFHLPVHLDLHLRPFLQYWKEKKAATLQINSPQEDFRESWTIWYLLDKVLGDGAREELVECPWGVKVKRVFQLRNLRKEKNNFFVYVVKSICEKFNYYLMDTSSTGPPFPPLNKKAKGHEIQVCLEWKIHIFWQPKNWLSV